MKAMKDFFKNEASYIEYTLLYMSGEQRTSILGITAKHYSNKELAKEWALGITSKISDEDAMKEVLRIYRRMVGDASAELPAEKAAAPIPELDPIIFGKENGIEALREKLQSMSIEELKAIIKLHGMDPFRSYKNSKSLEKLVGGMVSNAEVRINKGNCFRNYKG